MRKRGSGDRPGLNGSLRHKIKLLFYVLKAILFSFHRRFQELRPRLWIQGAWHRSGHGDRSGWGVGLAGGGGVRRDATLQAGDTFGQMDAGRLEFRPGGRHRCGH